MAQAGHGVNIGHGYVKYVIIDERGQELPPVVFPSIVARARTVVSGALARAATVEIGGDSYWTGDDALQGVPITRTSQDRLRDPVIIPALVAGAIDRFANLNGAAKGVCVSGLPAAWATEPQHAQELGARLRAGCAWYRSIRVVPEPVALIYSALLDNNGQIGGDDALRGGRVGVIDLGHYTDDICVVDRLRPVASSLRSYQTGTWQSLQEIGARLSSHFDRDFAAYQVDQAIRTGGVRVRAQLEPLPYGWDAPLITNGAALVDRLTAAWGRGTDLDAIVVGGGGAELEQKTAAILAAFPHAFVVPEPQLAIARGYARLARRYARETPQ